MYGRGIPSIAEQLGKSVQETQVIYDKVLDKFDGLAKFIEESENQAREYGYVTTIWGTRRQLPDMQLPYYEFKYKNGVKPDFDPLDLDSDIDELSTEVPDDVVGDLTNRLLNCRSFKQRESLKETIRQNGLTIKDNSSLIAQAQRQTVNCVDFATEILTTSGWKKYCDVNVGDEILSYNEETQTITKDHITHVHVYDGEYETFVFSNDEFYSVSTLEHRWVSSNNETIFTADIVATNTIGSKSIMRIAENEFSDNENIDDENVVSMFCLGQMTYEIASTLSRRQARLIINTFVKNYEVVSENNTAERKFAYSGTLEEASLFQYICVIAGYASETFIVSDFDNRYSVFILYKNNVQIRKCDISKTTSKGVWCVTTGNDTWIARRNGFVYITKNSRIQGSAANLTKLAQIELYNNQELKDLGFRMLIPVHDEIIAECPIENVKRCSELMSYCMVHAGKDLCVPLKCDVALFYKWYGEEIDPDTL